MVFQGFAWRTNRNMYHICPRELSKFFDFLAAYQKAPFFSNASHSANDHGMNYSTWLFHHCAYGVEWERVLEYVLSIVKISMIYSRAFGRVVGSL